MFDPTSIEQDFSYEPVLLNVGHISSFQPIPTNALEFLRQLPKGKLHSAVESINNGQFKPEQQFTIEDRRNGRAVILTADELQNLLQRLDGEDRFNETDDYYSEIGNSITIADVPNEQGLTLNNHPNSGTPQGVSATVNSIPNRFLFSISLVACFSGFLYGYKICLTTEDFGLTLPWPELQFHTGLTLGFAAVSALGAGILVKHFGLKRTLMISDGLFLLSALLVSINSGNFHKGLHNFETIIAGIAIGLAVYSAPPYLSDCAPTNMRPVMIIIFVWMLIFGFLIANILRALFTFSIFPHYCHGIPAAVQIVALYFLPESGQKIYKQIYTRQPYQARHEYSQMLLDVVNSENESKTDGFLLFRMMKAKHIRKALLIGCLLQGMQQLIGVNTIMYFIRYLIYNAKITSMDNSQLQNNYVIWICLIIIGCTTIGSMSSVVLISKAGTRKVLLFSIIGAIVGLLMLGLGFLVLDFKFNNCSRIIWNGTIGTLNSNCTRPYEVIWTEDYYPFYSYIPAIGLTLFITFVSAGLGPIPWLINLEIYPLWARSTALSISCLCHFLAFIVIFYTFAWFQMHSLILHAKFFNLGIYCVFGIIGLFAVILLTYFNLPEAKSLHLQEVERLIIFEMKPRSNI